MIKQNVRILTLFLIVFSLTGCSKKCEPSVITKTQFVEVPVMCKTSQIECKKFANRLEKITELIRCNYMLLQANKRCQ